jgi:hypothetical protein
MRRLLTGRLTKYSLITVSVVASVWFFLLPRKRNPSPPPVPVVSVCEELAPGMRRVGNRYGVQFAVPIKDFTAVEGTGDAIPIAHGFDLGPKSGKSLMSISLAAPLDNMAVDPIRVFSARVEKRVIFDDQRHTIGEDNWGYLSSGERWRKLHFRGRIAVGYGLVNESDAQLFDRVINSACLLPVPTP